MAAQPDLVDHSAALLSLHVPLLRIPPFPGASVAAFSRLPQDSDHPSTLIECIALLRNKRVGGTFWARQPHLPPRYVLVRSAGAAEPMGALINEHDESLIWCAVEGARPPGHAIVGDCDPWHMLSGATALVCARDDEVRLIAALLGVPTYLTGSQGEAPSRCDAAVETVLADALPVMACYSNPFGGVPLSLIELIDLCGYWRALIDSNRDIAVGIGFAFWKQGSVLPLLWGGGASRAFFRDTAVAKRGESAAAVWRSKAPSDLIDQIERRKIPIVEVEDGFLRSTGLGADCVPPLSITVDRLGPYFDPAQPSELETLLEQGVSDPALLTRARKIREAIIAAGLGKYGHGVEEIPRFDPNRRHILVAGQVEDDRSVMTGGCGLTTNHELLERVRANAPDAFLIYKPHPDVVAGHRKGAVAEGVCRQIADKVVTDRQVSSLINMVDEVHVNTSLTGFEALMRNKIVTTYGVPFYAGWGLTRDLGPVPARRTRRCSLDELVAATLLIYPRYLDPQSGLPCPAEVVVSRLTHPISTRMGALVRLRRFQGRLRARLGRWLSKEIR